uniref:J domain-containing protein n=1 Tax=viral metagenome TaxID=1070528 RepID=A0A6C0J370_9ZZZZ
MEDYYKILDIKPDSNIEDIEEIYNFKLSRYKDLPFLTKQMKIDIKQLKTAEYILFDKARRKKYNNILNKNGQTNSTKICDRLFSLKM